MSRPAGGVLSKDPQAGGGTRTANASAVSSGLLVNTFTVLALISKQPRWRLVWPA